jgi:hypothetical protein
MELPAEWHVAYMSRERREINTGIWSGLLKAGHNFKDLGTDGRILPSG